MTSDEQVFEHESYGVINISRVSSSSKGSFFGSSIQHHHYIELKISPAKLIRNLSKDWIMPTKRPFIAVRMSSTQFAEAITSLNTGEGTPVTIEAVWDGINAYRKMAEPKLENKRIQIDEEFEKHIEGITKSYDGIKEQIGTLCSTLPQKKRSEINKILELLIQDIESNLPFIKKQFTEQMDKTVLEAKGEIEGFVQAKINKLGLKGVKVEDFLLEDKKGETE